MLFILQTLVQWRKLILLSGFGTALVMAGISLALPKWYTASSSVFPPEPNQFGMQRGMAMAQSLQLPALGPNAFGAQPATIYVDILQSRRVGEKLLDEFDLRAVYESSLTKDALEELQSHTSSTVQENGLFTIRFEDQDPVRAAAVTSRYVELLDEFNRQLNTTRASRTKEFIREQIELRARDLREAEEELKEFQGEHQTLELGQQVASAIDIVSTLTADAIALEVNLEILRQYVSQSSQEYIRKKTEYDEILAQLQKLKVESARREDDFVRSYFPAFDKFPEVSLELARRIRRVKVEEKVHALLLEEYERARIEEARDTPTVQVLDVAEVPEMRSRPKRKMLVVIGGIVGIGWSSLLVIFLSLWQHDSQRGKVIHSVVEPIISDARRIFRKKRG